MSPYQSHLDISVRHRAPEGWDSFVFSSPTSSFCHLSGWGRVFEESMGLKSLFLIARDGARIRGVLPLTKMPRLGVGHVLVSMPFLNYGGPLGNREAQRALMIRALEESVRQGARKLELRNRREAESIPELSPGRKKVTVVLPLPEDPEILFKDGFKAKLRSQIRRPTKEGMEARFGANQRDAFYEVFSRNMRDLGTPVLPASFFSAISESFPDEADFGVVYHEGKPVAGGAGFHFRGEFEMTWASSLREFNQQAPNMLLYWGFMERCIEQGDRVFNFGRCTPGEGTHRFKRQWGGKDELLSWLQWPEGAPSENPESGVLQMAVKAWQKLPLSAANALGPRLARRIPTF